MSVQVSVQVFGQRGIERGATLQHLNLVAEKLKSHFIGQICIFALSKCAENYDSYSGITLRFTMSNSNWIDGEEDDSFTELSVS